MTTLNKLITQRNIIAEKIKKLQTERKRINNAISQAKNREKKAVK